MMEELFQKIMTEFKLILLGSCFKFHNIKSLITHINLTIFFLNKMCLLIKPLLNPTLFGLIKTINNIKNKNNIVVKKNSMYILFIEKGFDSCMR